MGYVRAFAVVVEQFRATRHVDLNSFVRSDSKSKREAIELAKTYGDQESGRFVNGVLDQLADRLNLKEKGEESNPAKVHRA